MTQEAMTDRLTDQVQAAAACLRKWGARGIYIFGSAARGTMREDSDIDIAVQGLPDRVFFAAMAEASRVAGRHIDLVSLDTDSEVTRTLWQSGELQHVVP